MCIECDDEGVTRRSFPLNSIVRLLPEENHEVDLVAYIRAGTCSGPCI
jgi:hypothetical protein